MPSNVPLQTRMLASDVSFWHVIDRNPSYNLTLTNIHVLTATKWVYPGLADHHHHESCSSTCSFTCNRHVNIKNAVIKNKWGAQTGYMLSHCKEKLLLTQGWCYWTICSVSLLSRNCPPLWFDNSVIRLILLKITIKCIQPEYLSEIRYTNIEYKCWPNKK